MGRLKRWWQSQTREQRRSLLWAVVEIAAIYAISLALTVWYDPRYWGIVYWSAYVWLFIVILVLYGRWWQKRRGGTKTLCFLAWLWIGTSAFSFQAVPAAGQSGVAVESLVVGVAHEGRAEFSAVPYASGAWGTDFLTVTHGLRIGGNQITVDGRRFEAAQPIVLCRGFAHGVDAMLLRVAAHPNRPVVPWGDASDLKPGDEFRVVSWRGLHPPASLLFLHHTFSEWADRTDYQWPAETDHLLVGEAPARYQVPGFAGYSGAPWVRNSRAYGMHKGVARAKPQLGREDEKIVALAEPVARIKECLDRMGYRSP